MLLAEAGGGSYNSDTGNVYNAGSGGGFIGGAGSIGDTGGTQISGGISNYGIYYSGSFGKGGDATNEGGGGAGWYGGSSGGDSQIGHAGSGGSGYIGNSLLKNKHMTGYNVSKSTEDSTYTNTTTDTSLTATSDFAKQGNGYARITFLYGEGYAPIE